MKHGRNTVLQRRVCSRGPQRIESGRQPSPELIIVTSRGLSGSYLSSGGVMRPR